MSEYRVMTCAQICQMLDGWTSVESEVSEHVNA